MWPIWLHGRLEEDGHQMAQRWLEGLQFRHVGNNWRSGHRTNNRSLFSKLKGPPKCSLIEDSRPILAFIYSIKIMISLRFAARRRSCSFLWKVSLLSSGLRSVGVCWDDKQIPSIRMRPLTLSEYSRLSTEIQPSSATIGSPNKCRWKFTDGIGGDVSRVTELELWKQVSQTEHIDA